MPEQLSLFDEEEPLGWPEYLGHLKPLPLRGRSHLTPERLADKLAGLLLGFWLGSTLAEPAVGLSAREVRRRWGGPVSGEPSGEKAPAALEALLACFLAGSRFGTELTLAELGVVWQEELPEDFPWKAVKQLREGLAPPASGIGTEAEGEHALSVPVGLFAGALFPGHPQDATQTGLELAGLVGAGASRHLAAWLAAMTSIAFVESHYRWTFELALSWVPAPIRLGKLLRHSMRLHDSAYAPRQSYDALGELFRLPPDHKGHAKPPFEHQSWRSALVNAGVISLALLYGEGELGKSLATATEGGWEASLNTGATGALLGTSLGAKKLLKDLLGVASTGLPTGLASAPVLNLELVTTLSCAVADRCLPPK